jgi:hypothetical protein
MVNYAAKSNDVFFLSGLVAQPHFQFSKVVTHNFKAAYDGMVAQ